MVDFKGEGDRALDDLAKSSSELQEKADAAHDEFVADQNKPVEYDVEGFPLQRAEWNNKIPPFEMERVPGGVPFFTKPNPKNGEAKKTQNGPQIGEADPFMDRKREQRINIEMLAEERERLINERRDLIAMGVDPDELEPIDGFEATKAMNEAHPLLNASTGKPVDPGTPYYSDPMQPDYGEPRPARYSAGPMQNPPLGDQRPELDADQAKATEAGLKRRQEQYVWDKDPRGKDSNPKDAIGSRKAGLSAIPRQVLYEVGLAMLEGLLKYARHNYRMAGVRASVYVDANSRHMDAFWEGQDIDPGSGLHHVVKAIASLVVLRDSMITGNWYDDRPPSIGDPNWMDYMNKEAERIIDAFEGEAKQPFIKGDNE